MMHPISGAGQQVHEMLGDGQGKQIRGEKGSNHESPHTQVDSGSNHEAPHTQVSPGVIVTLSGASQSGVETDPA
jgi:hypothetical protein